MKIVDAATTERHLEFGALIDALRTMFSDGCEVPLRHVHSIADRAGQFGWSTMPSDRHPIAGGAHVAYLEDRDGFEVELVAPSPD